MRWSSPFSCILVSCGLVCGFASTLLVSAVEQPAAPVRRTGNPQTDLATAEALLAAGRVVAAGQLYADLTRQFPGMVEAHRGLSRALAAQGRPREAAGGLRRLGEGLLATGRYSDAVEVLQEGVALDPQAATLRVALGRGLMLDQRFGAAAEHLARGLELAGGAMGGSGVAAIRIYLGLAQWESGDAEAAEATLRAVAESGSSLASQQLGRVLLWKGDYDEAAGWLRAAAEANPRSVDAQLDWARALEGVGELSPALAAYERVIDMAPERYPPHYSRARLLMRLGRRQEAKEEMARYHDLYRQSQAQLLDEGRVRARLNRGWELLADQQPRRAGELFAALGDHVDALVGLSLSHSALGLHAAAASSLERAVTLAPERQDLRLMLAEERQAESAP